MISSTRIVAECNLRGMKSFRGIIKSVSVEICNLVLTDVWHSDDTISDLEWGEIGRIDRGYYFGYFIMNSY